MPVNVKDIEDTLRNSMPVTHLEIEDQSSGCGQNYAIVLVSEVRGYISFVSLCKSESTREQAFEGKTTLARHRLGALISLRSKFGN